MLHFENDHDLWALNDVHSAWQALMPPRKVSVAEGAAETLKIMQPGGSTAFWSATDTPYMIEPMNTLASREFEGTCMVGPARSGKTMGFTDAWIAHNVVNDPGDMMVVQMTQDKAREFSKTRVDRALLYSEKLAALKSRYAQDDNTHDKRFKHGMWLRLAWPTSANLSGSDYRYVTIPDYDRTKDDVDGEGSKWSLGLKRTQTFMSRGMCAAESSPGRPIIDPNWVASSPHEAPAVGTKEEGPGILGIYNMGDRRRWYWQCPDCREHFEAAPGLSLFNLPSDEELLEMVREADTMLLASHFNRIICPNCTSIIVPKWKSELNAGGIWLRDGQIINRDREVSGIAARSKIASFWLGGVAATYQSWDSLLGRHFQALRDYALNGSEMTLKTVTNTDQAMPYMSRHLREEQRNSRDPSERIETGMQRYVVPEEARTVIVSVDVQGGSNARFVVQSHAVGPFAEQWLIDRYEIKTSKRPGVGEEFAPIDPARYAEDWDILTEKILRCTYRTTIENREIRVKLMVIDTGGEEGVSDKAYAYYRRLKLEGLTKRVMLTKGNTTKTEWVIKETLVGRRSTTETGDIPLYLLNPNELKDMVSTGIKRDTPGPGYIHFPQVRHPVKNPNGWLTQAFFDELKAEVRQENGTWKQIRKRNESLDCSCMIRAGYLRLGLDKISNWDNAHVPGWLRTLDQNTETITSDERRAMQDNVRIAMSTPDGSSPEAPSPVMRRRRVPSAYAS